MDPDSRNLSADAPLGLTGSTLMVLPVVGALIARGVDPAPLLREVGIDPRRLAEPSGRFADEAVQALWLRAPEFAGDPNFGLSAAKLYRRGLFWILDDLVASAETVRDAFERGSAHLRLLHDAADARLVACGPLTRLELLPNLGAPIARAQMEFFLACLVLVTRHLTGQFEHPREVHFRHAKPPSSAQLAAFFECPLYFGAEVSALVFPTTWLDTPVVSANALEHTLAARRATQLLHALGHTLDVTTRVRMLIGAGFGSRAEPRASTIERIEPPLESVAKRLAMSARTLRRRLEQAGTSYSELVDLVRQRYAARYLYEASGSLDEIAQRLGFANPTAFFKAHKRWTGHTPSELRSTRDLRWMGAAPLAAVPDADEPARGVG